MRTSKHILLVLTVATLIAGAATVTDARQVKGVVRDMITKSPLVNVTVRILQTGDSSKTNVSGIYVFPNVADGSYTFLIGRGTYVPMTKLLVKVPGTCCVGSTGNVDGSLDGVVDISDIFAMVDYLSASLPLSTCRDENDVNKDGTIDISDLFALIDYLASGIPLPLCP